MLSLPVPPDAAACPRRELRWGAVSIVLAPALSRRPDDRSPKEQDMTLFLIEREIDGALDLTQDDPAQIAQTSNDVVASLGVPYAWGHQRRGGRQDLLPARGGGRRDDP